MTSGGKVRSIGTACALVLVVGFGGWFVWQAQHPPEARFCTLALGIVEIDGQMVAIQDGGRPGDDGCETDETMRGTRVLGLDCKLRDPDGEVVAELVPNRKDGLCGRPEANGSYPDPWPHA